jgi:hypothetical protein
MPGTAVIVDGTEVPRITDATRLTAVAGKSAPFQRTIDPGTNPVPFTAKLILVPATPLPDPPRLVMRGTPFRDASTKKSLGGVAAPVTGLNTLTLVWPADTMSAAVIVALMVSELWKVVVRLEPFHRTIIPLT